jgi:hypothetical protein
MASRFGSFGLAGLVCIILVEAGKIKVNAAGHK